MSDLIDKRQKMTLEEAKKEMMKFVKLKTTQMPIFASVIIENAVEVVRCKDCKHRVYTEDGESNPDDIVCDLWETDGFTEVDYCSRSERRDDAD